MSALMEYQEGMLVTVENHFWKSLQEIKQLVFSQTAVVEIQNTHSHLIKFHMTTTVWEPPADNAMSS